VGKITNSLPNSYLRQERPDRILIILGLLVLLLHVLGFIWLRRPSTETQAIVHAQPFKLEVSMLSEPTAKVNPTAPSVMPQPKPNPKPKETPKKNTVEKQKPQDLAALAQMIDSQPSKQVTKVVKMQPESRTSQTVTSSVVQSHPKSPNAKDNFPESDLHNPSPEYPDMAIFLGYQGTAVVRIQVSAKGVSDGVEIVRSSSHKILDESAAKALRRWRFTPTNQADSVIVVVHFVLQN